MNTQLKDDTLSRVDKLPVDIGTTQSINTTCDSICSTCLYAPACFNFIRSKNAILFCEEFATNPNSVFKANSESLSRKIEDRDNVSSQQYTGLCSNCEHRKTCAIAESEGGVWHCEEFE